MSIPPSPSEQNADDVAPATGPEGRSIEVDLAAFLPEGVEIATEGTAADPAAGGDALAGLERDLDAVDAAIAALDAGSYGIDALTGEPIDDARLAVDPTLTS